MKWNCWVKLNKKNIIFPNAEKADIIVGTVVQWKYSNVSTLLYTRKNINFGSQKL